VRPRTGLIPLLSFVLAAAVACAPGRAERAGSPAAPTTATGHGAHTAVAAVATQQQSPKELRAQFEQLLGQHTFIAVRLMRSVVTGAPELRQAAVASLQENTHSLQETVASAYGSAQGDRFNQLWEDHVADLFAYAGGVARRDDSEKRAARTALLAYCDAYGAWLADASKGRVQASAAAAGVRTHVEELMKQIDVYAARDYAQAYRIEREAFEHMFTAGVALVKASVTPEAAVGVDSPPDQLRSAFSMLLGEHMQLIVDAQRASFAESSEFKAAAAEVNTNTDALTKAMGTIVGPGKAAEFQSAWARHVEGLVDYAAAVAGNDGAGKAAAEKQLDAFASKLARYFRDVVRNRLTVGPLTAAITMHDTHLIDHVDAYAAKDYTEAQRMELVGYQQMLGVAGTLVDAIQRTVEPAMPVGGSHTGGGGTAHGLR
jgi:hypothetical protein